MVTISGSTIIDHEKEKKKEIRDKMDLFKLELEKIKEQINNLENSIEESKIELGKLI